MNTSIYELRVKTGLNRKEFSKELGIPYMTLTDWELGKHEAPAYVYRLMQYYVLMQSREPINPFSSENECHTWEKQKDYRNSFPVTCAHRTVPVNNIYPLKQKAAIAIHEAVKNDKRVNNIILFGSSVTMKCTRESDIDLSVRLFPEYVNYETKNEISEVIQESCDWNADIIWFDRINNNERIYQNILKGVQIL